jgi:TRAP transporter TAXI family solute receptor
MRKALGWCVLASAVLLAAGCGSGDGSGGAGRKRFLSIGTAPPGGAFFVIGGAFSEALNASGDARGWAFSAEATRGTQENLRRLASGELDLALANSAITYFAVRGEEGWDRAYPIRTIMTLAPNVAMFITPADGDIKQIPDLRGKRVVVGPSGAGFEYFIRPLLAAHGVSYDDFTPLYGSQTDSVNMLADGSAAAAFLGGVGTVPSITQASAAQAIHFVPYDEDKKDALIADYLFFARATVPAGTYRGQDEDFNGLDVGSLHLVTSSDADEQLIYDVTRTLYEQRELVVERHAVGRAIRPENVVRNTGTDFHPGAVRYYEEIGIWPGD